MPIVNMYRAGGGGGGGADDPTYTDTYANIPAASEDGALFFPSDGFEMYRDDSAAWTGWGSIFPLTEPPSAGWSWVNQGTASVSSTAGGIEIYAPGVGADLANHKCRVRTAPAPPYTITALLMFDGTYADYAAYGLTFRESGTGGLHALHTFLDKGVTTYLSSMKFASPIAYTAAYVHYWPPLDTGVVPLFLRIEDDNTNRICSISMDGQRFYAIHTIGRTDFLTADEVGFYCVPSPGPSSVRLMSWVEA